MIVGNFPWLGKLGKFNAAGGTGRGFLMYVLRASLWWCVAVQMYYCYIQKAIGCFENVTVLDRFDCW